MIHLAACVECFSDALPEMREHLPRHWAELALDKDRVKLDPDWDRYARLDADGQMCIVTLRAQGKLVGYCWMIVGTELHYRTTLTAVMDIFYILPEYRGRMGGVRLFRAVEAELKRRGVARMYVGSKLHRDSSRLFKALGYREVEAWFSKMVE